MFEAMWMCCYEQGGGFIWTFQTMEWRLIWLILSKLVLTLLKIDFFYIAITAVFLIIRHLYYFFNFNYFYDK